MTRVLRLTIDIELDDLSDEVRADCEKAEGLGNPDFEGLPRLEDYALEDLSEPLVGSLANDEEIWAGTGVYARVVEAKLVDAVELKR